jgi:ATP-dependent DNA helicase MPH1
MSKAPPNQVSVSHWVAVNFRLTNVFIDHDQNMAWLIDDDDDPDIEILDSSPVVSRRQQPVGSDKDDSIEFVEPPVSPSIYINSRPRSQLSTLTRAISIPRVIASHIQPKEHLSRISADSRRSEYAEVISNSSPSRNVSISSDYNSSLHPSYSKMKDRGQAFMSPGRLSESEPDMPEPSFPVRPIAKQRKCHPVEEEATSSPLDMPPPSQRRLRRRHESSPVKRVLRQQHETARNVNSRYNQLFNVAAIHSGDETSEGSSDPDNDIEDESDRMFLQQMPETQLSPSYDQTLAYRQSLFTQPPAGSKAPAFANRPARRGMFETGNIYSRRRTFVPSSPSNDEPDEYAFGSFVVDDEAEISYLSSE